MTAAVDRRLERLRPWLVGIFFFLSADGPHCNHTGTKAGTRWPEGLVTPSRTRGSARPAAEFLERVRFERRHALDGAGVENHFPDVHVAPAIDPDAVWRDEVAR